MLNYILLGLTLLLAIPTSGMSVVLYLGWMVYKWRRYKSFRRSIEALSLVEKAVLNTHINYGGDNQCTGYDGLTMSGLSNWLILNDKCFRWYAYSDTQTLNKPLEFSLEILDQKYDVDAHHRRENPDEAIIRVRVSDPRLDQLYEWINLQTRPVTLCKWRLIDVDELVLGSRYWAGNVKDVDKPVPYEIHLLTNLRVLSITSERVNSLPPTLGRLLKLEELKLQRNNLTSLPDSICELPLLKVLAVGENNIRRLPERIGNLRALETLDVAQNELLSLPESIIELVALKHFCTIGNQEIILSDRQIRWLMRLINSGALVVVDVEVASQLPLEALPQDISEMGQATALFNHKKLGPDALGLHYPEYLPALSDLITDSLDSKQQEPAS